MTSSAPGRPARSGRLAIRALCAALALAASAACAQGAPWAQQLLAAINAERARLQLPGLAWSAELEAIAADHSRTMAAQGRVTHAGFQARFDRVTSELCVENVAGGTLQPQTLLASWSRAPGHRRNLLEPRIHRAGVAAAGTFVTFFACE